MKRYKLLLIALLIVGWGLLKEEDVYGCTHLDILSGGEYIIPS